MEKSWYRRVILAAVGFIMRLAGMRLKANSEDPAGEFAVSGPSPYRRPDPPAPFSTESSPLQVNRPVHLWRRTWSWAKERLFSRDTGRAVSVALLVAALAATVWGIYWLITGHVPSVTEYPVSPGNTMRSWSPPGLHVWNIVLPFAISRWWDVLFFGLWGFALAKLIGSYAKNRYAVYDGEKIALLVSLLAGGMAGAMFSSIPGTDTVTSSGTTDPADLTPWGTLALALVITAGAVLVAAIVMTAKENLGAGLRVSWCGSLAIGLVACIAFGSPGGLLFCFALGAIISAVNALIANLISIGKGQ